MEDNEGVGKYIMLEEKLQLKEALYPPGFTELLAQNGEKMEEELQNRKSAERKRMAKEKGVDEKDIKDKDITIDRRYWGDVKGKDGSRLFSESNSHNYDEYKEVTDREYKEVEGQIKIEEKTEEKKVWYTNATTIYKTAPDSEGNYSYCLVNLLTRPGEGQGEVMKIAYNPKDGTFGRPSTIKTDFYEKLDEYEPIGAEVAVAFSDVLKKTVEISRKEKNQEVKSEETPSTEKDAKPTELESLQTGLEAYLKTYKPEPRKKTADTESEGDLLKDIDFTNLHESEDPFGMPTP